MNELDTDTDTDSPGSLFDVFAKVHIAIDGLTEAVKKQQLTEQRRLAMLPNYVSFNRMSNPAGATDVVVFGGPQPGRQWVVRLLSAVAVPLAANVALVTWYVGQNMPGPGPGMLPASMAKWQFVAVPEFKNFTGTVIKVMPGENLIAGLTAVPAASFISLSAAIEDSPLYDASRVVSSVS